MKTNNKIWAIPLLVFFFLGFIKIAYGVVTCATTCDSTTASRNSALVCNATLSGVVGASFNATNGTLYLYSANTQNSSSATIARTDFGTNHWTNQTSGSAGLTYNMSYLANGAIADNSQYTAYITLKNYSGNNLLTCSAYGTYVTVDYIKPTTGTFDLSANTKYNPSSTTVTWTGGNASSGVTLYVGGNDYAMTKGDWSGFGAITYTYDLAIVPEGNYDVYTSASDGTNSSVSGVTYGVEIDNGKQQSLSGSVAAYAQQGVSSGTLAVEGGQIVSKGSIGIASNYIMYVGFGLVVLGALAMIGVLPMLIVLAFPMIVIGAIFLILKFFILG